MEENYSALPTAAAPPDTEPRLVHIGEIRFDIGETTLAGETPRGTFLYIPIIGGIIARENALGRYFNTVYPLPEGFGIRSTATEGLRAKILQGGGDNPLIYNNQLAEINTNAVAQGINDPHVFRITSHGLCEWNPLVFSMMRNEADARTSSFGEVNTWQVFRINTDSKDFAWLNFACVIGQEKLVYEERRLAATIMKLYQFLVR